MSSGPPLGGLTFDLGFEADLAAALEAVDLDPLLAALAGLDLEVRFAARFAWASFFAAAAFAFRSLAALARSSFLAAALDVDLGFACDFGLAFGFAAALRALAGLGFGLLSAFLVAGFSAAFADLAFAGLS